MVKLLYSKTYSHIFLTRNKYAHSFEFHSRYRKNQCVELKKKNISIICKNINFRNKLFNIRPLPIHHNAPFWQESLTFSRNSLQTRQRIIKQNIDDWRVEETE